MADIKISPDKLLYFSDKCRRLAEVYRSSVSDTEHLLIDLKEISDNKIFSNLMLIEEKEEQLYKNTHYLEEIAEYLEHIAERYIAAAPVSPVLSLKDILF